MNCIVNEELPRELPNHTLCDQLMNLIFYFKIAKRTTVQIRQPKARILPLNYQALIDFRPSWWGRADGFASNLSMSSERLMTKMIHSHQL